MGCLAGGPGQDGFANDTFDDGLGSRAVTKAIKYSTGTSAANQARGAAGSSSRC